MLTRLLFKTFIKENDPKRSDVRSQYAKLSGNTGIVVNLILVIMKFIAGIASGSISMIADALNNLSDAGSNIVTLIGIRLSGRHADDEHPLGHGRSEYVSALIVDMMIMFVGTELLKTSIEKIVTPSLPTVNTLTIVFLSIGIIAKLWLFTFYNSVHKKTNSLAIRGNAVDSISDVAATSLVLVSAIVAKHWQTSIDGWVGVLVSVFILLSGIKAAKDTVTQLLGASPNAEFIQKISEFIKSHDEVIDIHDLMVHDYGPEKQIVSFHVEINDSLDLLTAHSVVDKIETEMMARFGCITTIHVDPINESNEEIKALRSGVEECVRSVDQSFSIHDFRVINNCIYFDLCLPCNSKFEDEDAARLTKEAVNRKYPDHEIYIHAEHPFV